jgi:hypothetical protein
VHRQLTVDAAVWLFVEDDEVVNLPSVVDHDVDFRERLDRFVDETLRVGGGGVVTVICHRRPSGRPDLGDDVGRDVTIGVIPGGGAIVHHRVRPPVG